MSINDTQVAIIGGGAAGIAAGRRLHDAGVACVIVEARERLGGRGFTLVTDGAAVDLGCGWLHSADRNPWSKIAEAQGHTIDKTPPPWTRPALDVGFPLDDQRSFSADMDAFYDEVSKLARKDIDVAASAALPAKGRWNRLIGAVGTFISGGELDQVSALDFDNYADTDVNWRVLEGYGAVMVEHARGVPVVLGAPVTRIDRSGLRLRIETPRGAIDAEKVIVTLPSTVIAESEGLFFPALPEKTEAAAGVPLGLADKLFIALDHAEEFVTGTRLFGRTDAATGSYHLRPFGRPMVECYFGGELATGLEKDGVQGFFDFAAKELTGLFGSDFAKRLKVGPMHLWAADPFARGSYSFALPGKVSCRAALAATVEERIFFAGEACSTNDFSTAHGAFFTGMAAAEAIIAL